MWNWVRLVSLCHTQYLIMRDGSTLQGNTTMIQGEPRNPKESMAQKCSSLKKKKKKPCCAWFYTRLVLSRVHTYAFKTCIHP